LNFYLKYFYYRLRNRPSSLQNPLLHTPNPHLTDIAGTNLSIVAQRPFRVNGNVSLPLSFENSQHYEFGLSILTSEAADWKLLFQTLIVLWTSHINLCEKSRLKLTCITLPRPPFCATTTYLAYPVPLATPNRFGQARSLGASAPRELLFAPSGIVTHSV
jgi:hypothetical protein